VVPLVLWALAPVGGAGYLPTLLILKSMHIVVHFDAEWLFTKTDDSSVNLGT
jgi:hypothetical protein